MNCHQFDSKHPASAPQFDRQSDGYGESHLLADTRDAASYCTQAAR